MAITRAPTRGRRFGAHFDRTGTPTAETDLRRLGGVRRALHDGGVIFRMRAHPATLERLQAA
jgi:hypothetical protein